MVPATTSTVRLTCRSSISSSRCRPGPAHGEPLGVGVGGGPPHVDGHLAHALHQAPAAGRQLGAEAAGGPTGHVFGQVAVAFEVGEHPDDGDQVPQLLGRGDAGHGQLLQRQLLDVVVEGVDHLVPVGQRLGRLAVTGQQGVGGPGHRVADQGEQLEDLAVDLLEGVSPSRPPYRRRHAGLRRSAGPPAGRRGAGRRPGSSTPSAGGVELLAHDDPGARSPRQVAPRPVDEDHDLVAEPDEIDEVEAEPGQPPSVPRTIRPRGTG